MIQSTKQSKVKAQPAVAAKKAPATKQGSVQPQRATVSAARQRKQPATVAKAVRRTSGAATSKTEKILSLLQRPGGTTIAAVVKVTGWQAHSVRAFLSATIGKRMGLAVTSTLHENGTRTYSIER
jgi:hypothetical protein